MKLFCNLFIERPS